MQEIYLRKCLGKVKERGKGAGVGAGAGAGREDLRVQCRSDSQNWVRGGRGSVGGASDGRVAVSKSLWAIRVSAPQRDPETSSNDLLPVHSLAGSSVGKGKPWHECYPSCLQSSSWKLLANGAPPSSLSSLRATLAAIVHIATPWPCEVSRADTISLILKKCQVIKHVQCDTGGFTGFMVLLSEFLKHF